MAVLTNIPNNTSARDWRDTVNALIKRIAALEAAGVPVATPAPAFTTQPSISPTSGTAGSTLYAATPGTVSNGSVVSRAWLLNGVAISTGVTALPASSGTLAYQETASGPGGTTTSTVQVAAVTVASVAPTPAPSFTSQPSISPASGTAGATTFTATAGNVSNGSVTARSWTINGTVISTGLTASPASSGTLTYQETATGPGGTTQSTVQQVTVATAAAAAPAFITQPTVSPSTGTAGTTTYTATPGAVTNGTITSRAWSLNGSVISTGLTATPASGGTLTYQEFATGTGGSASSSVLTRTVSAATPTLALSPTALSIVSNAAAGTLVSNIANVPAGATPTVTPNDGRLVIAGDSSVGWKVVVGMSALSAGTVNFSVAAAGATGASGVLTVTAAPSLNYASRTTNTEPTPTLSAPMSNSFIVATDTALGGTTEGAGAYTWTNFPVGSNPGNHSKRADGAGVSGNSGGRAITYLAGYTSDGEMGFDTTAFAANSAANQGLLARIDTANTSGTFYELRFQFLNTFSLVKVVNGVETTLQTGRANGQTAQGTYANIKLRTVEYVDTATGSTYLSLRGFFNGFELISYIDKAPLASGPWGIRGGSFTRFKNFTLGAWQMQGLVALTPNVYHDSPAGTVVTLIQATTAGSTLSLVNSDGGRQSLVDTGRTVAGFKQYNLVTTGTATQVLGSTNTRSVQITETKGAATKTTAITLGVVAPLAAKPVRFVAANQGAHNSQVGAGGGAWHSYPLIPLGANADDVRAVFNSWVIGADNTEYQPSTAASVTKASVMIEGGRFRVPVTFAGARGVTIPITTGKVESDPITPAMFGLTEWPRGTQLRFALQGRVTGNAPVSAIANRDDTTTSFSSTYAIANEIDWVDDASAAPPNYSGKGVAVAAIFMTAVVGATNSDAVWASGDSITVGVGESVAATPTGGGWFGRMSQIGGIIPGYRAARSGTTGIDYINNGTGRRLMMSYATIGIDFFGTNDLGSVGTGVVADINAMHTTVASHFRAAGITKVLRGQLLPRADVIVINLASVTTDGVTTATATPVDTTSVPTLQVGQSVVLAGNTPTALNGLKVITAINGNTFSFAVANATASATTVGAFNTAWSNQLQTPNAEWGVGGKRDAINAKNVADFSGGLIDGVIDFTTAVSQQGDSTRWRSDGKTPYLFTGDITHPAPAGHTSMATYARNAILAVAPGLA